MSEKTCEPASKGPGEKVKEADKESLKEETTSSKEETTSHLLLLAPSLPPPSPWSSSRWSANHWQISGIFLEGHHITTLGSLVYHLPSFVGSGGKCFKIPGMSFSLIKGHCSSSSITKEVFLMYDIGCKSISKHEAIILFCNEVLPVSHYWGASSNYVWCNCCRDLKSRFEREWTVPEPACDWRGLSVHPALYTLPSSEALCCFQHRCLSDAHRDLVWKGRAITFSPSLIPSPHWSFKHDNKPTISYYYTNIHNWTK